MYDNVVYIKIINIIKKRSKSNGKSIWLEEVNLVAWKSDIFFITTCKVELINDSSINIVDTTLRTKSNYKIDEINHLIYFFYWCVDWIGVKRDLDGHGEEKHYTEHKITPI